jgi:heme-degrading monooxygenase HmoA
VAIEVLIRRETKPGVNAKALLPYIIELRSHAVKQPGYISGETLFSLERPEECLVISRWTTLDLWREWNRTARRIELDEGMEELLGTETEYRFYGVGLW